MQKSAIVNYIQSISISMKQNYPPIPKGNLREGWCIYLGIGLTHSTPKIHSPLPPENFSHSPVIVHGQSTGLTTGPCPKPKGDRRVDDGRSPVHLSLP